MEWKDKAWHPLIQNNPFLAKNARHEYHRSSPLLRPKIRKRWSFCTYNSWHVPTSLATIWNWGEFPRNPIGMVQVAHRRPPRQIENHPTFISSISHYWAQTWVSNGPREYVRTVSSFVLYIFPFGQSLILIHFRPSRKKVRGCRLQELCEL